MNLAFKIIKFIDLFFQSILFLVLAASIENSNLYQKVLPFMVVYQLVSCVLLLLFKTRTKLNVERIVYFFMVVIFLTFYLFRKQNYVERYFKVFVENGPMNVPLVELIFSLLFLLFCVWYYLISVREMRMVLVSRHRKKGTMTRSHSGKDTRSNFN